MIKKTILITAVLFMIIVPCVLGDASNWRMLASEKYLDIECEILTPEIGIVEHFKYRITIKNLTNLKIELNSISSNILRHNLKHEGIDMELKAYESITFEMLERVERDIVERYAYKEGDSFYMDFQTEIEFNNGESLYMYDDQIYPIKITNLNDGSDYIEYEWLDDRDTIYYFKQHIGDNIEYSEKKEYFNGVVYYQLAYRNISGKYIIKDLGRGETIVENRGFYHTVPVDERDEIDGTVELSRRWFFKLDGKYYMIFASRDYKTEFLADKPDIGIKIQPTIDLSSNARYRYKMEVYSNEKRDIENFCVYILGVASEDGKDYLMESGTLKSDENWIIEFGFDDIELFKSINFGYYINGYVYYWSPELELPILEYYEQNHIIEESHGAVYDFDYRIKEKQAQELENAEEGNFEIGTITPTPTVEIAATPEPDAENTMQIVARSRDGNAMTKYVVIILALVIAATYFSIRAIKKIYKEKEQTKE